MCYADGTLSTEKLFLFYYFIIQLQNDYLWVGPFVRMLIPALCRISFVIFLAGMIWVNSETIMALHSTLPSSFE